MRPAFTTACLYSVVLLLTASSKPVVRAQKVSPPSGSDAQREKFADLTKLKFDSHGERMLRSKFVRRRKRVHLERSHYWSATTGEAVLTYTNWTQRHDQKFLDTITVLNPAPKIIFPGTGTTKSTHDWSYFDMVYVITLEGHEHVRLKSVLYEVTVKANIPLGNVTVVKSKRDASGVRGCFNAHKFVADHALNNGYSRVVVFEDDVKLSLSRFTADRLRAVVEFLKMKDRDGGWDVFFFATMTMACRGSEVDYIKRVQSLTTAAYAATRETLMGLSTLAYSGGSVDAQYYSNLPRSYGHYPMLMYQRDDLSSTIKQRSGFELSDSLERLYQYICEDRGYYAIFAAGYFLSHPRELLVDLGKLWEDKATRIMFGLVSSPLWAPWVFAVVLVYRLGVVWGTITTLVLAASCMVPFLLLGGNHMLVGFINVMVWQVCVLTLQIALVFGFRAAQQCFHFTGPWYSEMRLMIKRGHVVQEHETLKAKKDDDYPLVAHQAPKWLFYLAIVLLGLGAIATLAGVLDAFSHKDQPKCDGKTPIHMPELMAEVAFERKALVTLSVGIGNLEQSKKLIQQFGTKHFDFILFHTESCAHMRSWQRDATLGQQSVAHIWGEREAVNDKLSFARKFLTPEKVASYSHVFLWDGDVDVPATFQPLQYLRLAVQHGLVISTPGYVGEQACDAATGQAMEVRKTAFVHHKYSVWRVDWWSQVWKFILSKYQFRYTCLMQLPFKCIVDMGTFREEVDSIVDKALFKEDRSVEQVGPAAKQDSKTSDWKNISVGTVIAQPIVQPSGSAVLLSEMLWDWSQVNDENKWFTEIIRKFDCEDQVSDESAMDGRSYCLTTLQRYNAAYDNFVRSMVKT